MPRAGASTTSTHDVGWRLPPAADSVAAAAGLRDAVGRGDASADTVAAGALAARGVAAGALAAGRAPPCADARAAWPAPPGRRHPASDPVPRRRPDRPRLCHPRRPCPPATGEDDVDCEDCVVLLSSSSSESATASGAPRRSAEQTAAAVAARYVGATDALAAVRALGLGGLTWQEQEGQARKVAMSESCSFAR